MLRFKGNWYCGFREGEIHNNHPSGRGRIIRSADGEKWETAARFEWDGGDVREPKLSITAEGWLMVNTSVYFVSKEPRIESTTIKPDDKNSYTPPESRKKTDHPDRFYQLDWLGAPLNLSPDDLEQNVAQQSVSWLSQDGEHWESANACPSGINGWRWDVTWYNGMG